MIFPFGMASFQVQTNSGRVLMDHFLTLGHTSSSWDMLWWMIPAVVDQPLICKKVFQPSIFRGELLVSGRVISESTCLPKRSSIFQLQWCRCHVSFQGCRHLPTDIREEKQTSLHSLRCGRRFLRYQDWYHHQMNINCFQLGVRCMKNINC